MRARGVAETTWPSICKALSSISSTTKNIPICVCVCVCMYAYLMATKVPSKQISTASSEMKLSFSNPHIIKKNFNILQDKDSDTVSVCYLMLTLAQQSIYI